MDWIINEAVRDHAIEGKKPSYTYRVFKDPVITPPCHSVSTQGAEKLWAWQREPSSRLKKKRPWLPNLENQFFRTYVFLKCKCHELVGNQHLSNQRFFDLFLSIWQVYKEWATWKDWSIELTSLRPYISHIKSVQKKQQRELEKKENPSTPHPKVKSEPRRR